METLLQASNGIVFTLLKTGYEIGLDWLGQVVKAIIEGVGIIGVGIIVFTLVLKAITLPFDIYQRVKTRKQTLVMRQMQPELEKLQKQYANDQKAYQQKMMELYKKNGYSMLGACLPMIISLVILIVAFAAFNAYSRYANLSMYEKMSVEYNNAIVSAYGVDGIDFTLKKDGEEIAVDGDGNYTFVWTEDGDVREEKSMSVKWENDGTLPTEGNIIYRMYEAEGVKHLEVSLADRPLYYIYNLEQDKVDRQYKLDVEMLTADETVKAAVEQIAEESKTPAAEGEEAENLNFDGAAARYLSNVGSTAAAEWYRNGNNAGFLWIKNVWYADTTWNHPIQAYQDFESTLQNSKVEYNGESLPLSSMLDEPGYNNLTRMLNEEKTQPNGYFILIILSIGLMVGSQLITMKSSKESNKYQTVDGQGMATQKVMLVVMPLMYAVFAFMYSAAFSIYMTMSSLIAILVTLLSNLIIGAVFRKKEEAAIKEKYTRTVPWKTEGEDGKSAKKSKAVKAEKTEKTATERADKNKKKKK